MTNLLVEFFSSGITPFCGANHYALHQRQNEYALLKLMQKCFIAFTLKIRALFNSRKRMHSTQSHKTGLISLYLSLLLLSVNGLFAKTIELDSTTITQLRSVIACIGLCLLLLLQKKALKLPSKKSVILVYALGFLMGIHWITFFQAMQVSSVAVGIISLFSYPVFTVLLEPLFYRRLPRKADLLAAVIVFVGVLIIASSELSTNVHTPNVAQGVAWGVLSALCYSLRNISQKYLAADIPSSNLMLHQVIAISLMLILFADWPRVTEMKAVNWPMLIALGLFCTAGGHTLMNVALKNLAAKSAALIACLQPVLAAFFAWLVLNEIPGPQVILGGVIILSVAIYESLQKK
ncbi:Permease of the drug/metabolite transporter (DMT) superfamily [Alteromonadaceae bacterium Bs31]|nr:Permease of the drug/metabolite transporter (DMT) superfamily [Alteromonadaceae bacterium Bs31]